MIDSPNLATTELAVLFQSCGEELMIEWRLQADILLRDLNLDKATITDHLPDVVAEITRDLALGREGAISVEHAKGSPPVHGVQRYHDGLDVGEVVAEYNLLRVAFHTVADRHHLVLAGEAVRIINHRLDEAVRLAVQAFTAQQALIRKEQQDQHLAFLAHDLRTPLNAVSLLVDELKYGMAPEELAKATELFEMLDRNLGRVDGLIGKVLETSAHHPGSGSSFQPERRKFELWPLVQRLIFDLRSLATKNDIQVENEVPRDLAIYADAGLVSQVFQNLLGNAFKYASKGRVVVSAADDGDSVTCVVQDNGAGIPLDMLSKVFDTLTTDPENSGTGLGLAIVKQIVEAHGGTASAESVHGSGATFTFTIPGKGH